MAWHNKISVSKSVSTARVTTDSINSTIKPVESYCGFAAYDDKTNAHYTLTNNVSTIELQYVQCADYSLCQAIGDTDDHLDTTIIVSVSAFAWRVIKDRVENEFNARIRILIDKRIDKINSGELVMGLGDWSDKVTKIDRLLGKELALLLIAINELNELNESSVAALSGIVTRWLSLAPSTRWFLSDCVDNRCFGLADVIPSDDEITKMQIEVFSQFDPRTKKPVRKIAKKYKA